MCSIMCCCRAGADREEFSSLFGRSEERGPDDTRIVDTGCGLIGFKRLAIMGLSPEGMQPFSDKDICVAANCTGSVLSVKPLLKRDGSLRAAATVNFSCRCIKNTEPACSVS